MLTLDIERASVSAEGIQNFYWPLPLDVSIPVRESLFAHLVPCVRDTAPENADALALRAFLQYFIGGVLRLFEATALVRAFERDGVHPEVPDRFVTVKALLDGASPPILGVPEVSGHPPGRRIPASAARLIRAVTWNSPSLSHIVRALRSELDVGQVVTPDVNPLLVAHARREGRALRFSPLEEWFDTVSVGSEQQTAGRVTDLSHRMMEVVGMSFNAGGEELTPVVEDWVRRWMHRSEKFVRVHWTSLMARQLPQEMWFSCPGANPWSSLLALAVRSQGGFAVAHDHGYGTSKQICQTTHHFTEFPFSQEYYTYNRFQAHVRHHEIRGELLLDASPPVITSSPIGEDRVPNPGEGRTLRIHEPVHRVLYVATAFLARQVRLYPIIPDVVALDFQARLLGRLRDWGVEVLYKPHPGGGSRPPAGFAERFGFKTDTRPFEQVDWPCDAYLIDYLASTTNRDVLSSQLPVAFLQMPYPELLPEMRTLLERRCWFVDSTIDSANRIKPDWQALKAFIHADEHVVDMTFPDAYYQGTEI